MKIKVSELRAVSEMLYRHLEDSGHAIIEIEYDYYWNIPKEDRYDVSKDLDLKRLDMGQLTDDWENLREIGAGKAPPISFALVWLSEILRLIGEDIVE